MSLGARPHVWVVRADGGRYVNDFVAGGYAAIDSPVDLSTLTEAQKLRSLYKDNHPEANPHQASTAVSQLESFMKMKTGDYVIAPESDTRWLRYGRVAGPCFFAGADDDCPYRNRRPVSWEPQPLKRHGLSESLQNTLGSLRTVFAVSQRDEFFRVIGDDADDDDGVEREDPDHLEGPFDPAKIRVRTTQVLVDLLMSRIEHDEIDLSPDFQRLTDIWKEADKSRLVESLLLRIPIPIFYFAADERENWKVVDGVQRISTIANFLNGKFALTKLEYLAEYNGMRYDELPRKMQRRIRETEFIVNVIEPGTPQDVMFNIFHRINTGGLVLKKPEIRHALNPGPVRKYLEKLSGSAEFLDATNRAISPKRMKDRECVLRFMAFHMEPWEEYSATSLDSHLNAAMARLNEGPTQRRDALEDDFLRAMRTAKRIFEENAFRKRYKTDSDNSPRRPINMALFESWSVQLARCSIRENEALVEKRQVLQERSIALLTDDPEFEKAISLGTGTKERIKKRFAAVRDVVLEVLGC